ncbi:hypothetical protein [Streptomyces sp. C10-9-1]|uniref:hypothetical protein n=1 Tax=Streptomyces sp. C10-9-1 TaxID=1859285 RepID=UPI003D726F6B
MSGSPRPVCRTERGRLLEPAQVGLTEKDEDGATGRYPLTAASPWEEEDLVRSYLAGAFGALSFLSEGRIALAVAENALSPFSGSRG